jgi:RNA:NAD 2'-phosphotransferase (TPT1/KptA family)/8-oxo-dGTP pyrophosphatase MutT (NUDIX family)
VSRPDPGRLSRALTHLLRDAGPDARVRPDRDGWIDITAVAAATEALLEAEVQPAELRAWAPRQGGRFEIRDDRIRLSQDRAPRPPSVPDILYHGTSRELAEAARQTGTLRHAGNRPVYFSTSEAQAWRAVHRSGVEDPVVLFVDASRARRRGVAFQRQARNGLFAAPHLAASHVLNLQPRFDHQHSAGGLPVRVNTDGQVEVALIQVTRRSGVTWEVAKGKIEVGERPEDAAIREVQEEMGVTCGFDVVFDLGEIRYGFVAPGGLHLLKTVWLYLLRPSGPIDAFQPSEREGIGKVSWFRPDQAARAVTHTSLVPRILDAQVLLSDPVRVARLLNPTGG